MATPTTPKRSAPPQYLLLQTPPHVATPPPPTTRNARSKDFIPAFQSRAAILASLYGDFRTYIDSIKLLQSQGHELTDAESAKFRLNVTKGDKLSNSYWQLVRDLTTAIRSIYLSGQDPESTLVLGYSSAKIVVECPYCDEIHEHKRVNAGIGVPVIYPAGCGAFGRYRIVFPGDMDKLTGGLGKQAVGIEVHKTGAYWVAVKDDCPNLESFFVVKYRPRPRQHLERKKIAVKQQIIKQEESQQETVIQEIVKVEVSVQVTAEEKDEEKMMFEAFQRLDIAEHHSYNPVAVTPRDQWATIKKLQEIAQGCIEKMSSLDQIVGYNTPPTYKVIAERWKETAVQRDTRSKVERETDFQLCTATDGSSSWVLGLVESDGFRTVCSCIRGPQYADISVVSGLVENERLEPSLPLNNKQLIKLIQGLAKEIGHEFPKEIPKGAVSWKRELERKNTTATSAQNWFACHAEKKMLVRYLMVHTRWIPDGFSHNFFKYRDLLGEEAGMRSSVCLTKDAQFWVSYEICEDCEKFIAGVCKKFEISLSFRKMEDEHEPPKAEASGEENEEGKVEAKGESKEEHQEYGKPVNENQKPKDSPTSGRSTTLEAPQQLSRRSAAAKQCNKSCCGKERTQDEISTPKVNYETTQKTSSVREKEIDIEKSAARQNVTLKVVGMTCTGCSRKAFNVLNNINGISSVRVTFVTGVAEFDLDPAISSLEQVLPQIEKETGFKFSQVVSDYQTLELHFDPLTAKSVYEKIRSIVESVEKIDKTTYRISYDPSVIGARTLLSSIPGASLAPPGNDTALVDGRKRLLKMSWSTGIAAVLTIPILALNWSDNPVPYSARSVVSLVLATFVQALAVPEFYVGALKSLIYSKVLEMDMLIVISITAAYGYSVVAFSLTHAGYVLQTGEFFETSSLLITLVLLGKLVAAVAKMKAISAVSLRSLQAEKAMLVGPSGETVEIDCRLLEMGDSFVVPPHSRVVTDGVITSGSSSIDESMITGESTPVAKTIHDEIIAGTINGPSPLTVRMTRLPGKNSITDIAKLVENALASKPRVQDIADKVASYFIPVVISIALIVFLIWIAVALKVRKENGGSAVGIAITYAIAVLAVSCPCAVGLAVPMVLVIAGGAAARSGVIIKQADSLERAYSITDVVFDKTGTITKGDLVVVHEEILDQRFPSSDIISLVRSLTKDSQHPVSMAVAAYLQQSPYGPTCLENTESVPGSGIQCAWKGSVVKAGNPYWLNLEATAEILTLLEKGMTLFCVTVDSAVVVVFGLKSSIRDEAQQVIANLQRRKINCHIVSGDAPKVVEDIAAVVGIPLSNVASRHSPAEKQQYIESLMASGRKVLFCGDGTNDAVAVAQADIGMQIGTTSDVTRAVADVVLLGGLEGVEVLLNISKRSSQRIIFNFVWAAFYNLFAIVLAGGAFVKARIPPGYAGLGEIVSVVPVIVAAMTLSRTKRA
ncbi:P-type cation-transporting ATPase [Drechslerella dactyloides]|uniref:P-type cation-transporting ATPase n=1 Tax=Drechslerella dactyloides TaxID=74499 RepID=A0AAD6NMH2_DREDA|nr:P-type cation-transporting ATPase [Drechslerella dactyloides]